MAIVTNDIRNQIFSRKKNTEQIIVSHKTVMEITLTRNGIAFCSWKFRMYAPKRSCCISLSYKVREPRM